jgi:hypothetical protein
LGAVSDHIETNSSKPEAEGSGCFAADKADIKLAGYKFYDYSGALLNDAFSKNAAPSPKVLATLVSMTGVSLIRFDPFTSTPGDLLSYTPDRINQRLMKQLGYADKMRPYGFQGANYVEFLQRNAWPIGINGQPYQLTTWAGGPVRSSSFEETDRSFTEQSWEFSLESYAGLSGGEGVEVFGLGMEFEASFLAGVSYHQESTFSQEHEKEWALESEGWGNIPPESPSPDAVDAFTFATYFLPPPDEKLSGLPSSFWARELKTFATGKHIEKNTVDPFSGSWRVVFVVTEIRYANKPDQTFPLPNVTSVYS